MSQNKKLVIGLFGFGVVGEGLYQVLHQTKSLNAEIKKICIKNLHKKRNANSNLFTTNTEDILLDNSINVIVEVINDADAAFEIVSAALINGKHVVSASKKMLAEHLQELLNLQKKYPSSLLYESAACASIPIIRNLEEYYDNDMLHSLSGIVNGSTNFILTKMFEQKISFHEALILAKQLGFAENDSRLDIEGFDAANKWILLLNHAFGIITSLMEIFFTGIQNIKSFDFEVAREKGYKIKLIAHAQKLANGKIATFILPQFIQYDSPFYKVENEFNAIVVESSFADKQLFYGKGAGSYPTASALLSDIAALRYGYKYEYKKLYQQILHVLSNNFYLKIYVSFKNRNQSLQKHFISIEEYFVGEKRSYICGVIHYKELEKVCNSSKDVSLILFPYPVIENMDVKKVKAKSLELAGICL